MPLYNSFTGRGRKPKPPKTSATLIPAPKRPPTGFYDPSIDAQVAAGARGLGDLRIDVDTAKRRGTEDYSTGLAELGRQSARTLADILSGETRTREDYNRATSDLGRQFGDLARGQAGAARARGVSSGVLAQQAAQARQGNQARAQGGLDQARDRAMTDFATQRTRFNENQIAQRDLLDQGFARQFGPGGDLDLQLARAEREQPLFEADANDLRLAQAKAADWVPPKPAWKFDEPNKDGKYKWPDGKWHSRPYRGN